MFLLLQGGCMKKFVFLFVLIISFTTFLNASGFQEKFSELKKFNPDAKITGKIINNSPILITGLKEKASYTREVNAAFDFIGKYSTLFSIDGDIGLRLDKVLNSRDQKTVRFIYTYKGYPIYPAGIAVTIDNNNFITKASFFKLSIDLLDTSVSFNREDAFYLVRNKYANYQEIVGSKFNSNSVREVVLLMGRKVFFAYEVRVASFASLSNTSYFIDARTGRLLFKKNNVVNLNKANVYNPNPGVDGKSPTVEVDITNLDENVTDKTLTGTLIRSTNCYGTGEQKEWTIPEYQSTMRFNICNIGPKAKSDENGDFFFTPDDPTKCFVPEDSQICFESVMEDDFAEVMMYYHANKMYTYFKDKGLEKIKTNSGLPSLMTVVNFKLPNFYELRFNCVEDPNNPGWNICTTDKYMPFDNAAFIPYDGSFDDFGIHDDAIVFGQGEKVDFAYDAEVTYHEFTHATIGSTSNLTYAYIDAYGMYIDPGAMNEGLADYFSSTVSGDPKLGEYVSNATEDNGALRDLSIDVRCPDNLWGESHNDGLLISNALWKIRMEFVKDFGSETLFDQKVYDTVVALGEIATFGEFSTGLLNNLKNDSNIGQVFADKAEKILKDNNIIECERIMPLENGKYLLFVEGTDAVGLSPYVPGYLQFSYDLPEGTKKFMLDMDIYSNSMFGGSDAEIRVLMKKGAPVEFEATLNGDITSNADFELTTDNNSHFETVIPQIEAPNKYYIAFVNYGGAQGILQTISASTSTEGPDIDAGVDTSEDTIVIPDVVENDADVSDTEVPSDVTITDIVADIIEDEGIKDATVADTGVQKDATVGTDIIIIDGSSKKDDSTESGCSCSVVE